MIDVGEYIEFSLAVICLCFWTLCFWTLERVYFAFSRIQMPPTKRQVHGGSPKYDAHGRALQANSIYIAYNGLGKTILNVNLYYLEYLYFLERSFIFG